MAITVKGPIEYWAMPYFQVTHEIRRHLPTRRVEWRMLKVGQAIQVWNLKPLLSEDKFYAEWAIQNQRKIKLAVTHLIFNRKRECTISDDEFLDMAQTLYVSNPFAVECRDN